MKNKTLKNVRKLLELDEERKRLVSQINSEMVKELRRKGKVPPVEEREIGMASRIEYGSPVYECVSCAHRISYARAGRR